MSLSDKSYSMIIYSLRMIIILIMGSMISPTEAAVSCTSTSPQCCWVRRIWELMGYTSVSSTSKTACCKYLGSTIQSSGIRGVNCTSTGLVTQLQWGAISLSGSIPPEIENLKNLEWLGLDYNQLTGIPPEIGKLVNLQYLGLRYNKLSGSIPSTIGNLVKLKTLIVHGNVGLSGTFTPNCNTTVFASNTNLFICGCATQGIPAFLFPPPGTPDACLATGPSSPLQKRVEIFSQNIGSFKYTCNVDVNLNPNQDCLNTQAKICNTTYMGTDATRLSDCKNGVDKMALNMSTYWQAVRRECGQWPWIDGFRGSKDTTNCAAANNNLIANAYYVTPIGRVYVTSALTDSVNVGLWSNTKLNG